MWATYFNGRAEFVTLLPEYHQDYSSFCMQCSFVTGQTACTSLGTTVSQSYHGSSAHYRSVQMQPPTLKCTIHLSQSSFTQPSNAQSRQYHNVNVGHETASCCFLFRIGMPAKLIVPGNTTGMSFLGRNWWENVFLLIHASMVMATWLNIWQLCEWGIKQCATNGRGSDETRSCGNGLTGLCKHMMFGMFE